MTTTLWQKSDIVTILTLNFLPGLKESLSPCDNYWILWLFCLVLRVVTISDKDCRTSSVYENGQNCIVAEEIFWLDHENGHILKPEMESRCGRAFCIPPQRERPFSRSCSRSDILFLKHDSMILRQSSIPDTWNAVFRGKFHITEKSLIIFRLYGIFP